MTCSACGQNSVIHPPICGTVSTLLAGDVSTCGPVNCPTCDTLRNYFGSAEIMIIAVVIAIIIAVLVVVI